MNVLVVADVHGDFEALSRVLGSIKPNFDVVVCPGDFTDIGLSLAGFSREDMLHLILDELLSSGKPVLTLPGNHDPPETHKIFDDYGVNLHGSGKIIGGVGFFGFGGAKTPFSTPFEPTEEDTYAGLKNGYKMVEDAKQKIIVTHNPPKNTKLDRLNSGTHVGSQVIRDFIIRYKPAAGVSAHIHEAIGTDLLGETKLIYPGPVSGGNFGLIQLNGTIDVKILRVEQREE